MNGPEPAPTLYRLLLRAFPRAFRKRFGADMEAVFSERLSEAGASRLGRSAVWAHGISDVLAHAAAERLRGALSSLQPGGSTTESVLQDLRFAVRGLTRSPGFTVVAVATLALGIGVSTAVFSVMHSVLWRPLPHPDAERLVVVRAGIRGVADAGLAPGEVLDIRALSRSLDALEAINGVDAHVEIDGEHERVAAASATDGVLPLLGAVPPALGRSLRADEDVGDPWVRSVVISDALWRRGFGSDPGALGREVQVNNISVRIVGILPAGFRVFLPAQTLVAEEIDVWFPTGLGESRSSRGYPALGRLAAGATLEDLQAELDGLAAQFVRDHPEAYPEGDLRLSASLLREDLTGDVRPALFALAAAVAFVLLIACMNVANLLLARGKVRERELAVRQALGAGRRRVARQLLTESLLLASVAAGLGLGLGVLGVGLVDWLRPLHLPRQSQIDVDGTVVLFAVTLSAATTLLFGVLPALRLSLVGGVSRLRGGRAETAAAPVRRLQRALVIGQVALSIVPLVGAGLMIRTFHNLLNAPLGFEPGNVLTAQVALSSAVFPQPEDRWAFFHQHVLPAVRELPGVEDASAGGPVPFGRYQVVRRYARDGDPSAPLYRATQQSVMPGYLDVMGIPLREGRDFTVEDFEVGRTVALVDERIARQLWPGGALGERLFVEVGQDRWAFEVVGVTGAVRVAGVRDEDLPHVFLPHRVYGIDMALVIETTHDAAALGPAIEAIIEPHTRRAVFDVRPMTDYVAESVGDARFNLLVLAGFALASLLLAGIGIHGTLSYLISQRTREFGVRVALGASAGRVVGTVVREGALLVAAGVAMGLAGALLATRLVRGLLYEVEPFDAPTLLLVCLVMAAMALLASWHPAWRATRVDPVTTLQAD